MRRLLAISPHLDDAVLSIGGYLARQAAAGDEITVFTVFAGVPQPPYSSVAGEYHDIWKLWDDPVGHRRGEDERALGIIGARAEHGDFLDAVYRVDETGSWLIGDGEWVTARQTAEPALAEQIAAHLRELIAKLAPDVVLTCAAIGEHIDHVRTREAVLAAVGAFEPGGPGSEPVPVPDPGSGPALTLWADMPYADNATASLPLDLAVRIGFHRAVPAPVEERWWKSKTAAVGCYASQHSMLWPRDDDFSAPFDAQSRSLAAALGLPGRAELLWKVARGH